MWTAAASRSARLLQFSADKEMQRMKRTGSNLLCILFLLSLLLSLSACGKSQET